MGLRQIGIELPYTPRRVFEPLHGMKQRFGCIVAHRRAGKTVAPASTEVAPATLKVA